MSRVLFAGAGRWHFRFVFFALALLRIETAAGFRSFHCYRSLIEIWWVDTDRTYERGSAKAYSIRSFDNITQTCFCAENSAINYSIRPATTCLPLVPISMAIGGRIADPCATWPRTNPPAEFVPKRDKSKTVRVHG